MMVFKVQVSVLSIQTQSPRKILLKALFLKIHLQTKDSAKSDFFLSQGHLSQCHQTPLPPYIRDSFSVSSGDYLSFENKDRNIASVRDTSLKKITVTTTEKSIKQ